MNVDKLGAIQMTTRTTPASPQVYARIGSVLYLIIIIAGARVRSSSEVNLLYQAMPCPQPAILWLLRHCGALALPATY